MTIWFKTELQAVLAQKSGLAHALLIKGARGIGKQAFALDLARALLCEQPAADGAGCGQCQACNWFSTGSHPDFRELAPVTEDDAAAAENDEAGKKAKASPWISIEQVRELHDFIYVSSHRGGRKVILVNP